MEIRTQLQQEWDELRWTLVDWFGVQRTLGSWLTDIRRAPDDTLGALLTLARVEHLAGRVIVQALLPKLVSMARRDAQAELGDYVSHLWLLLGAYPLERRPRCIAANLALDTLKAVCKDREPTPPATSMPGPRGEDGLGAAAVVDLARHHRFISASTAEVLVSVYVDALPAALAAAKHGLSEPALRKRCSAAMRAMSRHRMALAA